MTNSLGKKSKQSHKIRKINSHIIFRLRVDSGTERVKRIFSVFIDSYKICWYYNKIYNDNVYLDLILYI